MAGMRLTTDRLTLRHFTEQDMAALHLLLQDEAVNTFLPWFPMKNIDQTRAFYRARMAGKRYCFAVCFQGRPLGIFRRTKRAATIWAMPFEGNFGTGALQQRRAGRWWAC